MAYDALVIALYKHTTSFLHIYKLFLLARNLIARAEFGDGGWADKVVKSFVSVIKKSKNNGALLFYLKIV